MIGARLVVIELRLKEHDLAGVAEAQAGPAVGAVGLAIRPITVDGGGARAVARGDHAAEFIRRQHNACVSPFPVHAGAEGSNLPAMNLRTPTRADRQSRGRSWSSCHRRLFAKRIIRLRPREVILGHHTPIRDGEITTLITGVC